MVDRPVSVCDAERRFLFRIRIFQDQRRRNIHPCIDFCTDTFRKRMSYPAIPPSKGESHTGDKQDKEGKPRLKYSRPANKRTQSRHAVKYFVWIKFHD